ncbi:hypothetical protein AVEN_173343-1 [Araneus ventricosus]|uniref:Tc1-like transposase DDE domain-containing protein n=1 Tax=Araneus ventricosus TaxID=182803 RepID=A0A4Y2IB96_ARAVE|nr:hypothetical protein AVEN_173343-1 [Araneus ventricosus]
MSIVHSDGLGEFQQDNATPHASRVSTKWFQEHSSDFRHFHWPPKSPEMNIIEVIRDALLHSVEKRSPPPRTPMDLLTALQDSWCMNFLQDTFRHQSSPCHVVLRHFCVLVGARHDIKKMYQFFWLFSVFILKIKKCISEHNMARLVP